MEGGEMGERAQCRGIGVPLPSPSPSPHPVLCVPPKVTERYPYLVGASPEPRPRCLHSIPKAAHAPNWHVACLREEVGGVCLV